MLGELTIHFPDPPPLPDIRLQLLPQLYQEGARTQGHAHTCSHVPCFLYHARVEEGYAYDLSH